MPFYDENTNPVEVDAGPQFGSANYDFSFLDNYLQSVGRPTKTNPDEVIDDNNNFYQEAQDADEPDSQETQLLHQSDDDATKAEDDNTFNDQGMESYLFGDDEHMAMLNDLLNYRNDEEAEAPDATGEPVNGTPGTAGSLGNQISAKETQGKYTATNAHSSATGKYQFLWSAWGDSIKKVTGVKSQKEFLNNPQAQEKYYSFYEQSYLLPIAKKIKQQTGTNLTDDQVAKLVHFRGEGGAKKYLKGELPDKPEAHNMAISQYIKQTGGATTDPFNLVKPYNPKPEEPFDPLKPYLPKPKGPSVQFTDNRKINPATGKPFIRKNTKTVSADEDTIRKIIAHAKAQNVNPYDALAIALQETNIGAFKNEDLGNVLDLTPEDWHNYSFLPNDEWNALGISRMLREKLDYAKRLGFDKKGEAYSLQAYNGYGKLSPATEANYHQGKTINSYYEVPVTKEKPLNLAKNPVYGKVIMSLRDSVIKQNPAIKDIVESTPAFDYNSYPRKAAGGNIAATPTQQYIGLNDASFDEMFFPMEGLNTFRGLDSGEPVHITDEDGNSHILHGPKDTVNMRGRVYEKRLKRRS